MHMHCAGRSCLLRCSAVPAARPCRALDTCIAHTTCTRLSDVHRMHLQESSEQLQHIKQAGGVDALELLRSRTHHRNLQVAALEATRCLLHESVPCACIWDQRWCWRGT